MREIIPLFDKCRTGGTRLHVLTGTDGCALGMLSCGHFMYRACGSVRVMCISGPPTLNDTVTTAIEWSSASGLAKPKLGFSCWFHRNRSPLGKRSPIAHEVRDKYQRRAGINALRTALDKFADPTRHNGTPGDAVDALQTAVAAGISGRAQNADVVLIDAMSTDETARLHGFVDIDFLTGGLNTTDAHGTRARPSVGKTALASRSADDSLNLGATVLLFSLEMSNRDIGQRLGAMSIGVRSRGSRFQTHCARATATGGVDGGGLDAAIHH